MKYRTSYSLSFGGSIDGVSGEIRLPIHGGEFLVQEIDLSTRKAKATVTVPVDPTSLSIRKGSPSMKGDPPQRGIEVPEARLAGRVHRSGVRLLTFLLDEPIRSGGLFGTSELVPESDSDEMRLGELEGLPPYAELHVRLAIKSPRFPTLDETVLEKLLEREVGLALYSDAMQLTSPIGQYREFWRVLESAFGQKDSALVSSLVDYPPAQDLGFDAEELKRLRVLRGRASHAESSAGLGEYVRVSEEVTQSLPRLLTLVEQVLLTKASWGARGGGVDRLAPLRSFVKKDGTPVLVRPQKGPQT